MTKKRPDDELPSLENFPQSKVLSENQKKVDETHCEILGCSVSIPFATKVKGYATRRIDTSLTQAEALIFKAIRLALVEKKTRLRNGRFVKKPADVYRWIAEKIAEAHGDND